MSRCSYVRAVHTHPESLFLFQVFAPQRKGDLYVRTEPGEFEVRVWGGAVTHARTRTLSANF